MDEEIFVAIGEGRRKGKDIGAVTLLAIGATW